MRRLLLDAHISPEVAHQVFRHQPECDATSIRDWRDGMLLREPDDAVILQAAHEERRTLLTYDVRTVPEIADALLRAGGHHSGIILIDDRSVRQGDVGALVRALMDIWPKKDLEWGDQLAFLPKPAGKTT